MDDYKKYGRHKLTLDLEERIWDEYLGHDYEGYYYEWTRSEAYYYGDWDYTSDWYIWQEFYPVYGDEAWECAELIWDIQWMVDNARDWEFEIQHKINHRLSVFPLKLLLRLDG